MSSVNKHAQRSERTRAALLGAARTLFGEHGYAEVGIEQVVRAAGVTRGALYHQFPGGKEELFRETVESVEAELVQRIAEEVVQAGATDPLAALRIGARASLDASVDPAVARITLVDAPAVLGPDVWREIGQRYGLGIVRASLEAAMEAGVIRAAPVDPLAQVMLAAIEEAARYVARAADREAARDAAGATLDRLVDGLR
jgi:AcrR family transcriptional regulator